MVYNNLVNALHEGKYTIKGLSNTYYKEIYDAIKRARDAEPHFFEGIYRGCAKIPEYRSKYDKYADIDPRLSHVSVDDFFLLAELQERYEEEQKGYEETLKKYEKVLEENGRAPAERREYLKYKNFAEQTSDMMQRCTDRVLVRRLAQDMCEDVKAIFNTDYENLRYLGYRGEQDVAIPEITRGNFNIYIDNQVTLDLISGYCEDIDRMRLFLKRTPIGTSESFQIYNAEFDLMGDKSISKVRKELGEKKIPPFTPDQDKYLDEFYGNVVKKMKKKNMDVSNEEQKTKVALMNGNTEVTCDTYEQLATFGYDGSRGHPMLKSGYEMYVHDYAYNKMLDECEEEFNDRYDEVRRRPFAFAKIENLENDFASRAMYAVMNWREKHLEKKKERREERRIRKEQAAYKKLREKYLDSNELPEKRREDKLRRSGFYSHDR